MPATHTADFQTATVKATNLDAVEQINVGIETEQDRKQLNIVANAPEIRIQDKTGSAPEVNATTMSIVADGGATHFRAGTETFAEGTETKGNVKFQSSTGATTHAEIVGSSGTLELQDGGLGLKLGSNVSVSGTPSAVIQEITGPHARESAVLKKYPEVAFAEGKFDTTQNENVSTHWAGHSTVFQGGYSVKTSTHSTDDGGQFGWHTFDDNPETIWKVAEDYDTTTGNYDYGFTGVQSRLTDTNSTNHDGDHVIMGSPNKLKIAKVSVTCKSSNRRVVNYSVLGSNSTGTTGWTLLNSGSFTAQDTNTAMIASPTTHFKYHAFVVRSVTPGVNGQRFQVNSIHYYGYEEVGAADDSVDTTVKSVYNAPDLTSAALYIDGKKSGSTPTDYGGSSVTVTDNGTWDSSDNTWSLSGTTTSNIVSGNLASLVGDHPHSISAWVKADQLNGDGLFHVGTADGAGDAASRVGFVDDSHISWGGEDNFFSTAEWHNVTYVYNGEGSDKKLFLDGRHVGTAKNEDTFGDYPPFAMSDYRQYGYTVSASGINSNYPPYYVFDGQTAFPKIWISPGTLYTTSSTGGISNGGAITEVDGVNKGGEWIQIEFPFKLNVDYVAIRPPRSGDDDRAPQDGFIVGSTDGITWTSLLEWTGITTWGTDETVAKNLVMTKNGFYKYFRLIVTRLQPNNTNQQAHITELQFFGHRENDLVRFPDSVNTLKYPHVAMTGPAQRGYVATASSEFSNGDYPPYNAFNNVFTGSDPTHTWNSKASAYHTSSDGQYNGSDNFSTTISGTAYAGEWIQIELPRKVVASALKLGSYGSNSGRSPRAGAFAGSNDGSTWDLLKTYGGETSWTQGTLKSFAPSNNTTTAYKYFRFVITHVQVTNDGLTALQAFEVHGTEPEDVIARVGDGFDGKVRNVRVFSTALSDARVQEIFDADKDEFGLAKSSVSVYRGHLGVGTAEPKAALTVMDEVAELEEFPPRAMTADETYMEGHGVFKASVSEGYARTIAGNASGDEAWLNFDKTRSNWTGGNSYTGTSNTYAGTHTSGGYGGDYIELTLPYKIKLQQFIIQPSAGLLTRWSKSGVVVAKNANHDTWTNIFSWSGSSVTDAGAYSPVYFRDVDATNAYDTFRLVITSVDSQPYVTLWQWRLFGTREQGASTLHNGELSLTRNLTVPRIGPPLDADDTPRRDRLVVEYNTSTNPTENGFVKDTSGLNGDSGTGTYINGKIWTSTTYDLTEKAFSLTAPWDGISSKLPPSLSGNHPYSFSIWVKPDTIQSGNVALCEMGQRDANQSFGLYVNGGVIVHLAFGNNLQTSTSIAAGQWTHIVGTYVSGSRRTYANGVLIGSDTYSSLDISHSPRNISVCVGASLDVSAGFGGFISQFKLYDVALTGDEVKRLYDMGRCDEGHHVVNFSKTRVGIGLGDGEAPRAALDVRGDIYGGCPVYFAATATSMTAADNVIIWDDVKEERGGGYDASTGTFTVPIAGVYKFYYTIRQSGSAGTAAYARIQKNGSDISSGYGAVYLSTTRDQGSATALIRLSVGDTIRIYLWNFSTAAHYNSFVGEYFSSL